MDDRPTASLTGPRSTGSILWYVMLRTAARRVEVKGNKKNHLAGLHCMCMRGLDHVWGGR